MSKRGSRKSKGNNGLIKRQREAESPKGKRRGRIEIREERRLMLTWNALDCVDLAWIDQSDHPTKELLPTCVYSLDSSPFYPVSSSSSHGKSLS